MDKEREAYELLSDDERQCYHCKATFFFSAVFCDCNEGTSQMHSPIIILVDLFVFYRFDENQNCLLPFEGHIILIKVGMV